jgi:RNA polymerase sigma-70 factor (ECF subfamily)
MPEDSLAALVETARRGSARATRTLVVAVGPAMIQVVRRILGSRHPEVEDTFQEAALAFVQALATFRGQCSTKSFACRIAAHKAMTARRRATRTDIPNDPDGLDEGAAPDDPAETARTRDWALARRRRELLHQLLDELSAPQAETLVLHCVVGLTVHEVADSMGVPVETARSRLRLAKAALRARIASDPVAAELLEGES